MANPINPHDKFFRSSMKNTDLAQEFFQHYLPSTVRDGLDFGAIKLVGAASRRDIGRRSIINMP